MNPFFGQRRRSAHSTLITYLSDALREQLPPDLMAAPDEEAVMIGASGEPTAYRPDVTVKEPWTLKEPSALGSVQPPPLMRAAEPNRVLLEEKVERWIEIRDKTGSTVLELFSPTNNSDRRSVNGIA
jgi:hypothetical protein